MKASMQSGVFFDRETFGADKLIAGLGRIAFKQFLEQAPSSAPARETIVQIQAGKID